jgi:hypothetical protein
LNFDSYYFPIGAACCCAKILATVTVMESLLPQQRAVRRGMEAVRHVCCFPINNPTHPFQALLADFDAASINDKWQLQLCSEASWVLAWCAEKFCPDGHGLFMQA